MARTLALLLPGLALIALTVALSALAPDVFASGLQQTLLRLAVIGAVLYGAWRGLVRADVTRRTRLVTWFTLASVLIAWQTVTWLLAVDGFFQRGPFVPVAVILPLVIGLPILLRSRTIGALLDAIPATWLVGLQVYRVFGYVFVIGWAAGTISTVFGLPAGLGDTLVGLLALPAADQVRRGRLGVGLGWNVLGILDLVNAVSIGILTTPGPAQLIVPDRVSVLGSYPLVLIPAFAVPLSLLLHAVSLRQLRRRARAATAARDAVRDDAHALAGATL